MPPMTLVQLSGNQRGNNYTTAKAETKQTDLLDRPELQFKELQNAYNGNKCSLKTELFDTV